MASAAKLADQLRQVGLDAEYWADILKTNINITLPQQVQYLDESHLNVLKDFTRHGWEEKALRKFLDIKSELLSSQPAQDVTTEIVVKLKEAGLDGEHWADVLKTKLGITRMEQIANIQTDNLKKLKDAVRHDWEEQALRRFFGISDDNYEASLANIQNRQKQRREEAKKILEEVVELKKKGVHHTDHMINSKINHLRQLMNVPKEQWVENYDDRSLDDMISKMNSDLQDLEKLFEGRPVNKPSDILVNASAGLALRGVLVGKAFSGDYLKNIVLSKPTDVKLMNPVMLQVDDVAHFSSKEQSDHFHSSLDTMGYSFATALRGGGWGINAEAGFSKHYEKEDEKQSEFHKHAHFESRVVYSVVPTAACELNLNSLKLSQDALRKLKGIDRLLIGSINPKIVGKSCEEFFTSFGSHINAGVLHFGGVNKLVATYKSNTKTNSNITKSMVTDALTAYVSASYSGCLFSVGGAINVDHMTNHGSFTADYEKSEQAKTCLHTTRNGGPQEVSTLSLWKMGLVTCNSTWALIDRGHLMGRDFVGIWELIPNHKDDFQEPYELASFLMAAWERLSGYLGSIDQRQNLNKGLDAIDLLVSKIADWNSQPVLPERCIEYLQDILDTIEQVEAQTGTNKYWENKICTEENISSFMTKVVELKDKFAANDVTMIKFLIRKLVSHPAFRKFPGKQKIMEWADLKIKDIPSILASARVESIPDLIRNMKERFIPTLQREHRKNAKGHAQISDSIYAGATIDLAGCLCKLLRGLQSSGKSHEVFFLKVTLLPLKYDWSTMTFEALFTMKKLQNFVQCFEDLWKEFQVHKEKGIIHLEAFLIHNSLKFGNFNEGNIASEQQFSEISKDLLQVISPQLNTVLTRYSTNSPFNWVKMASVTSELATGNMSVVEEREVDIGDLKEIFGSHGRNSQGQGPSHTQKPGVTAQGAFLDIIKTLNLEEYYPCKISLYNAMIIKTTNGQPKLDDLPWMIIRKLLMVDFHAMDQILTVQQSEDGDIDDGGGNFDLNYFLHESQSTSDCEEKATQFNTLDVLVAIFTCCDNFLKQTVVEKLFVCKLAIPFLYPLGSEGNIGMSLWALRTITVQWQANHKTAAETPVTNCPFPLVTFVRLGRPPLSKSKLMNDILRDDSHDTFFNHDCNNGTIARRLTDGLVECSWFITAGKYNEHLPDTTMLLNLRGDASSRKSQMQILQEISSVMFVIVTVQDLIRKPNIIAFQQILQAGAKVILFLIDECNTQGMHERKTFVETVGKDSLKGVRIILSSTCNGIQKNASELKNQSRKQLSGAIAELPHRTMTIEECAQLAEKMGIITDEYEDEACLEGKVLAEKVINHMKGKDIADCKNVLLPLQGTEWIEYCKLQKAQHRASGKGAQLSTACHADVMKQKMDGLREKQLETCSKRLNPFIKDFIAVLQNDNNNQNVVLYFLKWIKMFLDKVSRANLPGLRRQYHNLWNQFQLAKKQEEKAKMEQLKPDVNYAEIRLASASLGLENLFRELGQIYEAIQGCGKIEKETRIGVEYLPEIAAKLLMKGIPLELIDGDASSIPISWVRAVLSKLENIIGEKRLFVLSVLGIQSSGKSTLLNTMFGLQFAVSAGRCTRGAYMQLIPVDDHAELPFSYIVVVDTEGIRAPELGQLKYEHDNELATLVIGLGDVTMLNIKGENTSEMKDILQIAVHAFLRMNLVSKHIKDHKTCIFVHQNVPSANAEELMMYGCQKLQEGLDDMAKEAAHSENITNIHSFSQIINFDVQKHVWYFSDLWHGNPPMAPANPGYSEKVNEVRLSILGEVAKKQTTFLTTSDLSIRLADLWNGVLNDDFVFSFRNSLEVKAYNNLQSRYYTLEWGLQCELRTWLQKAEIKLKMCETIDNLESTFHSSNGNLAVVLARKADEIKTCLKSYFEENNLQEIIIQWQQSKLNQMDLAVEQQISEGKTYLLSIKAARKVEILQIQKWSVHERSIMNKAVELADKLRGIELTNAKLKDDFDAMWVTMVHELSTKHVDKECKMDQLMEQVLRERFHNHGQILSEELQRHQLDINLEQTSLEGSIRLNDVQKDHICLSNTWLWNGVKKFLTGANDSELQARNQTLVLTDSILHEISTFLKDLSSKDLTFQKSHATNVIQILWEKFDTHNQEAQKSKDCTFTILPKYVIKLAVHVSRHCVQEFSFMQFEYNKKHGVKAKLNEYKETAWHFFVNMVKQSTEEVMAGDLLCTELKGIIEKAVKKEFSAKCIGEVLRDFHMTKYYLIVKMMDDLACKGNFKDYESYIKNAKDFALRWITQYTNEKMFSIQHGSGMSRYAEIFNSDIGRIIICIAKSVACATNECKGDMRMTRWIDTFCQTVSTDIAVPVSTLKHVSSRNVVDFDNLQRIILEKLEAIEADLMEAIVNERKNSDIDVKLPQLILDRIWGCPDQCPFCKEPCADTTVGHYSQSGRSHMCVQHRPKGIGGVRWDTDSTVNGIRVRKDELVYDTCNYSVQLKNRLFNCSDCDYKCRENKECTTTGGDWVYHKYLEYKNYLQSWDIAPDATNNVSKYWMWFLVTYQSQLKNMYNAKLPDIPGTWSSVTQKDALADLRQIHN